MPKKKAKLPLSKTHPKLAKEAYLWDPKLVMPNSNKTLKWQCTKGHTWSAIVFSRSKKGTGCPYCSGRRSIVGINDLKTTHPKIAKDADGWNPKFYKAGSKKKLNWRCKYGHKTTATISNRSRSKGCPVCSGQLLLSGFNDLKTTHPNLAREADGWDPSKILAGTSKKLNWKCKNGHKWSAIGFSRIRGNRGKGLGCPICSNQKVLSGLNDLKTTHPNIAKFAVGWDPTKYVAGSTKKVKWTCKNKHIWVAPIYLRTRNKDCSYCNGDLLWKGFNDLKTTHPEIAKEAYGWETTKLMAGSLKKVKWKCKNGHIWTTSVAIRTRKMRPAGCPTCAQTGFDSTQEGWLYFIEQPKWDLYQIGITNYPDHRIATHKGRGWRYIDLIGPFKGSSVRKFEKQILSSIKKKGAKILPGLAPVKFDGYTEAWSKSTFPVKSIKELMRLTKEFEENNK